MIRLYCCNKDRASCLYFSVLVSDFFIRVSVVFILITSFNQRAGCLTPITGPSCGNGCQKYFFRYGVTLPSPSLGSFHLQSLLPNSKHPGIQSDAQVGYCCLWQQTFQTQCSTYSRVMDGVECFQYRFRRGVIFIPDNFLTW
jgi:hypothetical protein